jgi:hypothetical protein
MRLIDRLFEFLYHHRLTPYNFERECGIANGYLQKQKKGKGTIGSEILEKISMIYKDLNLTWLITGKGSMINESGYAHVSRSSNLLEAETEYSSADQTIRLLKEKIALLENALADKEKIIRLMESKI